VRIPADLRLPDSAKEVEVRACVQERIIAPPRQQLGQLLSRWPQGERPPSMLESFHRHSGQMAISAITLSELLQYCPMAPRHPCITARSALPWNAGECRSA
jgi:virulence-associated protein VagC